MHGVGRRYAVRILYRYPMYADIHIRVDMPKGGVGPIPRSNTIFTHRFSIYVYLSVVCVFRLTPFWCSPRYAKRESRQDLARRQKYIRLE